jgi:hypothetical protein
MTATRNPKSVATTAPVEIPPPNTGQTHTPEFLRLPPPGQRCTWTGLSRSAINELILPTPRNRHKPAVKSFCLRQRGAKTGIRLVDYAGLRAYIRAHAERGEQATATPPD